MRAAHNQGVRGISTRKVYPSRQLPAGIVRSYRTFSPLPAIAGGDGGLLFSVTLSMPAFNPGKPEYRQTPPVRRCGALCCPDFPPLSKGDGPVYPQDLLIFLSIIITNSINISRRRFYRHRKWNFAHRRNT